MSVEIDLTTASVPELVGLYQSVLGELRRREVLRTWDSPTGGWAEWLVGRHFGVELATNVANPGFDLVAPPPYGRIQVKAVVRRPGQRAPQLTPFGDHAADFDTLALVCFTPDLTVEKAVLLAGEVVRSKLQPGPRGQRIHATASVIQAAFEDVTKQLQAIAV